MKKIVMVALVVLFIISCRLNVVEKAGEKIDVKQYKQTIVTPVLESIIPAEKNLLYCCTFQLAWNEGSFSNESEIGKFLNKKTVTKEILSPESYVISTAKSNSDILKLKETLKGKFGDQTFFTINDDLSDGSLLLYACMSKLLQFQKDFNDIQGGIDFNNQKVKAFGLNGYRPQVHAGLEKQVEIYDYKRHDDFIIKLISKSANDEIVLARVAPKSTLLETFNAVEDRMKKVKPELLKHADCLYIPEVDVNVENRYKELETGGIVEAYQWTKFSLNKKGAEVKSEARIIYKDGGHERRFNFNGPFLIYLKEKGKKYPYLALWVNNSELMNPEIFKEK